MTSEITFNGDIADLDDDDAMASFKKDFVTKMKDELELPKGASIVVDSVEGGSVVVKFSVVVPKSKSPAKNAAGMAALEQLKESAAKISVGGMEADTSKMADPKMINKATGEVIEATPQPTPEPTLPPVKKPIPAIPFVRTAVEDPNPLTIKEGSDRQEVKRLASCIALNKPCRMLYNLPRNGSTSDQAPYKFTEYISVSKCCSPLVCKERDVAAVSYYRGSFDGGTSELVGSVAYCDFEEVEGETEEFTMPSILDEKSGPVFKQTFAATSGSALSLLGQYGGETAGKGLGSLVPGSPFGSSNSIADLDGPLEKQDNKHGWEDASEKTVDFSSWLQAKMKSSFAALNKIKARMMA